MTIQQQLQILLTLSNKRNVQERYQKYKNNWSAKNTNFLFRKKSGYISSQQNPVVLGLKFKKLSSEIITEYSQDKTLEVVQMKNMTFFKIKTETAEKINKSMKIINNVLSSENKLLLVNNQMKAEKYFPNSQLMASLKGIQTKTEFKIKDCIQVDKVQQTCKLICKDQYCFQAFKELYLDKINNIIPSFQIKYDELQFLSKKIVFKKAKISKDLQIKINVKIQRNINEYPFSSKEIPKSTKLAIKTKVLNCLLKKNYKGKMVNESQIKYSLDKLENIDPEYLNLNQDYFAYIPDHNQWILWLFVEDHLQIQFKSSLKKSKKLFVQASELFDAISNEFNYSYDPKLGYSSFRCQTMMSNTAIKLTMASKKLPTKIPLENTEALQAFFNQFNQLLLQFPNWTIMKNQVQNMKGQVEQEETQMDFQKEQLSEVKEEENNIKLELENNKISILELDLKFLGEFLQLMKQFY